MPDTSVVFFDSTMTGIPTLGGAAGNINSILDACLQDGFGLKTIDSLIVSGGVATATISTGHSARQDMVVLISGSTVTGGTPGALNGRKKVISTTGNTVVFDAAGVSDQSATGTITLKIAPAGWTKVFSGTNLAAYKSGNVSATGCYLRVDDTATLNARVLGYESMTDVNTGTGPFPAAAQLSGGQYWTKANNTSGTRKWWIVASDKFVYFGIAYHATYPDEYQVCGFGDIVSRKSPDAYCFVTAGFTTDRSASSPAANASSGVTKSNGSAPAIAAARSYTQIGTSALCGAEWIGQATSEASGAGTRQYPNGPDNGILLDKIHILEAASACLRGYLPGSYACPQATAGVLTNDSTLTSIPGLTGRKLFWKILGATATATRGGFAIDITGPWA